MRAFKLLSVLCFLAAPAFAGERLLGTIVNAAGPAARNNATTAAPFVIPNRALISVQCDVDAYIATDTATATSANGVKVFANVLFPTSVGSSGATVSGTPTAVVSVLGSAAVATCKVFERMGNE